MSSPTKFPFAPPTVLAPLHGVSHRDWQRLIVARGAPGLIAAPFLRITRSPLDEAWIGRRVERVGEHPLSVQLLGNDPAKMARAAAILNAAGADVVDLNLGCSVPRIVRKGVGAALLRSLGDLEALAGAVRGATRGRVSAKIRAGFESFEESTAIAERLATTGIDFLTVHPRRRTDRYEGVADWRIVRTLAESIESPIVGNGDLWYAEDAWHLGAASAVDAVMLGRPVLRNPWIFRQIEDLRAARRPFAPSGADLVGYFEELAVMLQRRQRGRRSSALDPFKGYARWNLRAVPQAEHLVEGLKRSESLSGALELLNRQLRDRPAESLDLQACAAFGLEQRPPLELLQPAPTSAPSGRSDGE